MNAPGRADDKVNRRRKQSREEVDKVSHKDRATQKKPRFIWTRDVHNCFLVAIDQIGFYRAVPTKILEVMNLKGLTRENVASHLQKYRLQVKRREQERAHARAASENVSKGVYPYMSRIPQQPCVLPPTMRGINMDSSCLDGSLVAPSLPNHNSNMIPAFPTIQEMYGMPFKDSFDEGDNRMSSARLMHGLYNSNGPHDINKIGYNYGPLPMKPLGDSYAHNSMNPHDMTDFPQYDWLDELSLQDISSPFVPQYDKDDKVSLEGIISPSFASQYDQRDELFVADQGIISPSFVPQYDRRNELFVADQGIISPLLAQNMEGLEVGLPRLPEGPEDHIRRKVEGLEVGVPRMPEATGGIAGMTFKGHVPHLPEANECLAGMKDKGLGAKVAHLPEATGGPGIGVPQPPEATGGPGLGVAQPPEATGGLTWMNDFQRVLPLNEEEKSARLHWFMHEHELGF